MVCIVIVVGFEVTPAHPPPYYAFCLHQLLSLGRTDKSSLQIFHLPAIFFVFSPLSVHRVFLSPRLVLPRDHGSGANSHERFPRFRRFQISVDLFKNSPLDLYELADATPRLLLRLVASNSSKYLFAVQRIVADGRRARSSLTTPSAVRRIEMANRRVRDSTKKESKPR